MRRRKEGVFVCLLLVTCCSVCVSSLEARGKKERGGF